MSAPTTNRAAAPALTPIIEVSHVTKTFTSPDGSPLPVLDDISLELREREIIALLGRSGSGKSTLLNVIGGLDQSDGGEVLNDLLISDACLNNPDCPHRRGSAGGSVP